MLSYCVIICLHVGDLEGTGATSICAGDLEATLLSLTDSEDLTVWQGLVPESMTARMEDWYKPAAPRTEEPTWRLVGLLRAWTHTHACMHAHMPADQQTRLKRRAHKGPCSC